MAARCFVDSCGITWEEVITGSGPAFSASVEVAPFQSLVCTEGEGLSVDLLDDTPTVTTRSCANTLRRTPGGELFSVMPQVETGFTTSPGAGYAAVPEASDAGTPATHPTTFSYFNNTDCEVMVMLRGQFEILYGVLRQASAVPNNPGQMRRVTNFTTNASAGQALLSAIVTPYNAQMITRLQRQITGANPSALTNIIAQHFDLSGIVIDVNPKNTLKSEWRDFTWIEPVGANSTITFTAQAWFDGPEQTVNVRVTDTIDGNGDTDDLGFRVFNCDIFALPLQVN